MNLDTLDSIIGALPKGRTVFYDFEDRYAVLLLFQHLRAGRLSVAEIKRSHLAPLLEKPAVKNVISRLGRADIESEDLLNCWPTRVDAYRLTLGVWPTRDEKPKRSWHQTTRLGYSLVLQLNLPVSHKRNLEQKIEDWRDYTNEGFHPVAGADEITLAWSRIDLDFSSGEALIEEIQSDWIRDVKWYAESSWATKQKEWSRYYRDYLQSKVKHWSRTMLTATLWFLIEELGLRTVFFHTHESGSRLKNIKRTPPPRSIYTDLPRKFCFRSTHNGPAFLRDSEDKHVKALFAEPETKWYVHTLP